MPLNVPSRHKLVWAIAVTFFIGLLLEFISVLVTSQYAGREFSVIFLSFRTIGGLGEAAIIASIIAFTFERLLSEARIEEIKHILELHRSLERFGFRATYPDRQEVFDEILQKKLSRIDNELKIMGICVSLFRESGRSTSTEKRPDQSHVVDTLTELVMQGRSLQVLFLKRYPSAEELREYGIPHMDFHYVREQDEDEEFDFSHGKRLKKIANLSLENWIQVLLGIVRKTMLLSPVEREAVLKRFEVREYIAIPSLSLYILDDNIYVTPYLFKRRCSDVPAFRVGGKESPLYEAYRAHFASTWTDRFTKPAIPKKFLDLLIADPEKTLRDFHRKRQQIEAEFQARSEDREFSESPERWRESERAIEMLLRSHS